MRILRPTNVRDYEAIKAGGWSDEEAAQLMAMLKLFYYLRYLPLSQIFSSSSASKRVAIDGRAVVWSFIGRLNRHQVGAY